MLLVLLALQLGVDGANKGANLFFNHISIQLSGRHRSYTAYAVRKMQRMIVAKIDAQGSALVGRWCVASS